LNVYNDRGAACFAVCKEFLILSSGYIDGYIVGTAAIRAEECVVVV